MYSTYYQLVPYTYLFTKGLQEITHYKKHIFFVNFLSSSVHIFYFCNVYVFPKYSTNNFCGPICRLDY